MSSSLISGISLTLFTARASRTHVKAPQTDFPVKPDNLSGSTHDSPSEKPLRTKVMFQTKTAPKKHREHQTARRAPKPSTDQLLSLPIQFWNRDQGPKGSIETKTPSTSMPRAMERARKASRGFHGSMPQSLKHSRLGLEDRFRFLSLWKERFHLSFSLFRVSTRVSVYIKDLYYRVANFAA